MASAPLVDLDRLDLSRVVVDRAALDAHLQQRNTFAMLQGVLFEDVEGRTLVGYRDIRSDDWWAADHIPGRPMFPGALQIETAAQLCAYDYSAYRLDPVEAEGKFIGFGGVEDARFRSPVIPDCRFLVVVRLLKHSRRIFRYATQGFVDGQMVFEGTIIGVLV
jgi:3-hydroxyacyl-[acyl-carrier-protein] dehydratase